MFWQRFLYLLHALVFSSDLQGQLINGDGYFVSALAGNIEGNRILFLDTTISPFLLSAFRSLIAWAPFSFWMNAHSEVLADFALPDVAFIVVNVEGVPAEVRPFIPVTLPNHTFPINVMTFTV